MKHFWGLSSDPSVGHVHCAPPCGTASRARDIQFPGAPPSCGACSSPKVCQIWSQLMQSVSRRLTAFIRSLWNWLQLCRSSRNVFFSGTSSLASHDGLYGTLPVPGAFYVVICVLRSLHFKNPYTIIPGSSIWQGCDGQTKKPLPLPGRRLAATTSILPNSQVVPISW